MRLMSKRRYWTGWIWTLWLMSKRWYWTTSTLTTRLLTSKRLYLTEMSLCQASEPYEFQATAYFYGTCLAERCRISVWFPLCVCFRIPVWFPLCVSENLFDSQFVFVSEYLFDSQFVYVSEYLFDSHFEYVLEYRFDSHFVCVTEYLFNSQFVYVSVNLFNSQFVYFSECLFDSTLSVCFRIPVWFPLCVCVSEYKVLYGQWCLERNIRPAKKRSASFSQLYIFTTERIQLHYKEGNRKRRQYSAWLAIVNVRKESHIAKEWIKSATLVKL